VFGHVLRIDCGAHSVVNPALVGAGVAFGVVADQNRLAERDSVGNFAHTGKARGGFLLALVGPFPALFEPCFESFASCHFRALVVL
jgi:hypothetical protein